MMPVSHIEDTVFRWQNALYQDLQRGVITTVQFIAGVQASNDWAIRRYASWASQDRETDICVTTSF